MIDKFSKERKFVSFILSSGFKNLKDNNKRIIEYVHAYDEESDKIVFLLRNFLFYFKKIHISYCHSLFHFTKLHKNEEVRRYSVELGAKVKSVIDENKKKKIDGDVK